VGAVAIVALALVGHEATRGAASLLSRSSQKELERLEHDTFESPDSTYAKALAQLHNTKVSQGAALEAADAWARPTWPQPPKMAAAHSTLPDLEHRIAADVSKSLAKTVAQEVAKALATSRMPPQQKQAARKTEEQEARRERRARQAKERHARAQEKLLREVSQQVAADAAKMSKDQNLLQWVQAKVGGKAKRHALMSTFSEPVPSVEPSRNAMPLYDAVSDCSTDPGTAHRKALNPKPYTLHHPQKNPKPETRNPKPETRARRSKSRRRQGPPTPTTTGTATTTTTRRARRASTSMGRCRIGTGARAREVSSVKARRQEP
jgi:hypothetical protein